VIKKLNRILLAENYTVIKKLLRLLKFIKPQKELAELKGGWAAQRSLPKVDVLIDVGVGHQGTPGLYKNTNFIDLIFIEPLIECRQAVEDLLIEKGNIFIACALSDFNGESEINFTKNMLSRSSFDTLLNDGLQEKEKIEKRKVPVHRLDDIKKVQQRLEGKSYGIKLDIEGHEPRAIAGGMNTIKNATFLILEAPVGEKRYDTEMDFHEYIVLMMNLGFKVHSIRMGKGGGRGHCDIAFVKMNDS